MVPLGWAVRAEGWCGLLGREESEGPDVAVFREGMNESMKGLSRVPHGLEVRGGEELAWVAPRP